MNIVKNCEINSMISNELINISINSSSFHSPHEGWAVIREEYYETLDELNEIKNYLDKLDDCVRNDKKIIHHKKNAMKIKEKAIRVIEESVQIAATAIRYIEACDNKINDFKKLN